MAVDPKECAEDPDGLEAWVGRAADPTLGNECQHRWIGVVIGGLAAPNGPPCPHLPVGRIEAWTEFSVLSQATYELCQNHLKQYDVDRVRYVIYIDSLSNMRMRGQQLSYAKLKEILEALSRVPPSRRMPFMQLGPSPDELGMPDDR